VLVSAGVRSALFLVISYDQEQWNLLFAHGKEKVYGSIP
jgi:hypothetical protein